MPKAIVQPISNFTARDGLCLLAALVALLLSLREGQIQVNLIPLGRIPIRRDETRVREKGGNTLISPLPGPLVSDLDGDGLNEIIVVDSKCGLRLFHVIHGALVATEVTRESELVVKNTGRPVAINAGYLKSYPNKSVYERPTKVVIIVRDDWLVRCFDSELRLMWERYTSHTDRLLRDRVSLYRIHEAAATVSPLETKTHALPMGQTLKEDDGVVLVGGSMCLRDDVSASTLGDSKQQRQEEERLARTFTVFAMTGATGDQIWEEVGHNTEEKVRKQVDDEEAWKDDNRSSQYKFPKGFYFDKKSSLEETNWHAFKAAVLENMPHSWASPVDTRLHVAKLRFRRRSSKGNQPTIESSSSSVSAAPSSAQLNYVYTPKPDMVVAHTSSGMAAVNIFTGEKLFSLPLPSTPVASPGGDRPELWGDINGDDVIEHIQVAEKNGNAMDDDHENVLNVNSLPACYALVTSGIPTQHVFNGSICDAHEAAIVRHRNKYKKSNRRRNWRPETAQDIKAATPLILTKKKPRYYSRREHEQTTSDIIFAVNLGIITSYSNNGLLNWQVKTGPTWSLSSNGYLSLLPLESHGTAILAVGDTNMMIYDCHGEIIGKADIMQPLTKPPIIVDVDSDGIKDIIAVGSDEIVIYKLSRIDSRGSQYLVSSIVLLCLGIIVAHIIGPGGIVAGRHRKRATD